MYNVPLGVTTSVYQSSARNFESPVEILGQGRLYSDSEAALAQASVPWTVSKLRHTHSNVRFFKPYV